jgi:hypothetical protein
MPKFIKLHDTLMMGPEHHLVINAFNLKNKMPPSVLNNKKLKFDHSFTGAIN